MSTRLAGFLRASLSIVALLAGCGGEGEASAHIVSVTPGQIDIATDQPLGTVWAYIVLSADTGEHVCAASSSTDLRVEYVIASTPTCAPESTSVCIDPLPTWVARLEPDPDLSVGEHTGYLEVFTSTDPGCARSDGEVRAIPYRLSKVDGFAEPEPVALRLDAETTADDLHGSARIDMAAGPERGWTAWSPSPWLVVDTPSGLTGTDVQFHVDPAQVRNIISYGTSATATIEVMGDTRGMTPRSVSVTLQLALPFARLAMPTDQPAGPARRFRVRGRGFTEKTIADGRLVVQGVPGAVVTRLSDLDLVVQLPAALPAGSYRLVTNDALGIAAGFAVLRLTAPAETERAVLPGDGADGHMLWDGARNALLVLEPPSTPYAEYSNTLRHHALRNGAWITTGQWVDNLRRIGFSPDGLRLMATSDSESYSASIFFYDPQTGSRNGVYSYPRQRPEPPSPAPLAVTVDGSVWSGTLNALLRFDLSSNFTMVSPSTWGWSRDDVNPARTIASRDGGRLLVSRFRAGAFVYLDVADSVPGDAFHVNPAGATTFDAISDDGGRVLSGVNVYDGDFALLGTLPGPAILSGDGRRAFTLENRSDWQMGGPAPVVHVFDLTAPADGGGALPELGTVDLLDHVTCAASERTCAPTSSLAVTPDGRVFFAQTAGGVVVVPIPEGLLGP